MTKRLVIAEKPSVGMTIAAILGASARKDGYMEGQDYIVSWGFGHLTELANAIYQCSENSYRVEKSAHECTKHNIVYGKKQ